MMVLDVGLTLLWTATKQVMGHVNRHERNMRLCFMLVEALK